METKTTIKDFYGKIIGYIITKDNGEKTVKDFYGRIRGKYDPRTNTTKDFYGRVIARGDCASMLLNDNFKN